MANAQVFQSLQTIQICRPFKYDLEIQICRYLWCIHTQQTLVATTNRALLIYHLSLLIISYWNILFPYVSYHYTVITAQKELFQKVLFLPTLFFFFVFAIALFLEHLNRFQPFFTQGGGVDWLEPYWKWVPSVHLLILVLNEVGSVSNACIIPQNEVDPTKLMILP